MTGSPPARSASERLVHELKVFPNHNTYNGSWLDGRCHGDGLYTWSDGTEYAGEFREGLMWGQGEKRWPSGRRYCGEWAHDMMWGNGEMSRPQRQLFMQCDLS
ncbi:PIP5K5 [Symbiodinium pilosum]|uniref:PIP5K5 protein n=1 Tax=Symbiodinium pilosum TaxID=2952 RepID=A0A812XYF1_SYMPI|nr:PIP5K5 [Symbiodinium pilosum]